MEAVAACIADLKAKGWAVQRIAEEVGCSTETLRSIRRGEISNPGFLTIAGLHRLAGRSLDPLVGIEPPTSVGISAPAVDTAALARELLRELGRLGAGPVEGEQVPPEAQEPNLQARHSATQARRALGDAGREALDELSRIEAAKRPRGRKRA